MVPGFVVALYFQQHFTFREWLAPVRPGFQVPCIAGTPDLVNFSGADSFHASAEGAASLLFAFQRLVSILRYALPLEYPEVPAVRPETLFVCLRGDGE